MTIDVRVIRPDEFDEFVLLDQQAFQFSPDTKESPSGRSWARGETDRAFAAFLDGEMAGIGRNYSFDVTVPGGARVPAGAVSWIGVSPAFRRRGVLTAMMDALAGDSRDHGEPLSMLTASEGTIYRRFGYGPATDRVGWTIERTHGAFVSGWADAGRVRFVSFDEATTVLPAIYERTRDRVGSVARPDFWWPEVLFEYPGDGRFVAVHQTDGVDDGYTFYLVTGDWEGGIVNRTVEVIDLQAADDRARLALWRYLLDIDLVARVKAGQVPIDDPVRWALADPRRRRVDYVNDGLWVKVLDVERALGARRYEHDGEVRFAVRGDATYALRVVDGVGECERVTGTSEVELDADVLGALYLGARNASRFVAMGGVSGSAEAVRSIEQLFVTASPPAMLSYF